MPPASEKGQLVHPSKKIRLSKREEPFVLSTITSPLTETSTFLAVTHDREVEFAFRDLEETSAFLAFFLENREKWEKLGVFLGSLIYQSDCDYVLATFGEANERFFTPRFVETLALLNVTKEEVKLWTENFGVMSFPGGQFKIVVFSMHSREKGSFNFLNLRDGKLAFDWFMRFESHLRYLDLALVEFLDDGKPLASFEHRKPLNGPAFTKAVFTDAYRKLEELLANPPDIAQPEKENTMTVEIDLA